MFYHLSDFARAYQQELLRTYQKGPVDVKRLSNIKAAHQELAIREYLFDQVGTLLINLGERIKGEDPCPELSHGQA